MLATNENGNIVFARNKFGNGWVYFLNFPMEYNLFVEADAFNQTDWYKIYREVAKSVLDGRVLVSNNPQILTTVHKLSDDKYLACAINYSDKPQPADFTVKEGWTLTVIEGNAETLDACDGAFMQLNKIK